MRSIGITVLGFYQIMTSFLKTKTVLLVGVEKETRVQ